MTKMTKTVQLVLAIAVVGGSMATAQHGAINSVTTVPGIKMQTANASKATQVKDDLFADTVKFSHGASSVTEINLDPTTMSMVGSKPGQNADLARKMSMVEIHTYKYDKPGMYRVEDVDAIRKKFEDGSWRCSVHTRNQNGSSDICTRGAGDPETNEMVIITVKPQKLTFIHMKGKMSLDDLNQASRTVACQCTDK
jgi:hypothetical protein